MRLLILGAGGVGAAAALIAARRPFLSAVVVADVDHARAERAAARTGELKVFGRSAGRVGPGRY